LKLSREIKTAIVGLGGTLLFILGFTYLKSSPIFDNKIQIYAVYDNVGGLQTGNSVSINGYKVGQVKSINFLDRSGKLIVTMSIDDQFKFSKKSVAELFDTGIIGGKGIQIVPDLDPNSPIVVVGDTLVSSIKPGVTELVQQQLNPLQLKVENIISNADSLLVGVNKLLDPTTRKNLQEGINGINGLIQSLTQTNKTINELLIHNKTSIDSSLVAMNQTMSNLSHITDTIANMGLDQSLNQLSTSLSSINSILSNVEKGEGNLGKLAQEDELYENLERSTKELSLLLQDMRLNPKRYINVSVFGKKQKEYKLPENDPANQNQ
jgi:phospholipid/cholesterol/gamma-HCH transport system substrate-binding protein